MSEAKADELVSGLDGLVLPGDARTCVVRRLARDGDLAAAVSAWREGSPVPDGVHTLVSTCVLEVRAAPQFLSAIDAAVPGGLSKRQRECVERGFHSLSTDEFEAAVSDALGEAADKGAAGKVGKMVRACGVKAAR